MNGEEKLEPSYTVLSSDFFRTYVDLNLLPASPSAEVAFIGRSNAGKSSLLNALLDRKDLARTSAMPGKTQALNYFTVNWASGEGETRTKDMSFFVDLPGYGYAKVARSLRATFHESIEGYLSTRRQLRSVILVCDSRRDPTEDERFIFDLRRDVPCYIAITKVDKLGANEHAERRKKWVEFARNKSLVFSCSAKDRRKFELPRLRERILAGCAV